MLNFKNHKFKPHDDYIEDYEYDRELDENLLAEGCLGEDCPIICPFCRKKDYKIFYGNKILYKLFFTTPSLMSRKTSTTICCERITFFTFMYGFICVQRCQIRR